jgi:hypothetical protein
MATFGEALQRFTAKVTTRSQAVYSGVVAATHESITKGSGVTGAPGQPVDSGELVTSWQVLPVAPWITDVVTNAPHARSNEDGIARPGGGPYRLLSPVGGRHSVRLTITGMDRLVEAEVRKVNP